MCLTVGENRRYLLWKQRAECAAVDTTGGYNVNHVGPKGDRLLCAFRWRVQIPTSKQMAAMIYTDSQEAMKTLPGLRTDVLLPSVQPEAVLWRYMLCGLTVAGKPRSAGDVAQAGSRHGVSSDDPQMQMLRIVLNVKGFWLDAKTLFVWWTRSDSNRGPAD